MGTENDKKVNSVAGGIFICLGLIALTIAGFLIAKIAGFIILGLSLLFIGGSQVNAAK
jgi:hypothetical protein